MDDEVRMKRGDGEAEEEVEKGRVFNGGLSASCW